MDQLKRLSRIDTAGDSDSELRRCGWQTCDGAPRICGWVVFWQILVVPPMVAVCAIASGVNETNNSKAKNIPPLLTKKS